MTFPADNRTNKSDLLHFYVSAPFSESDNRNRNELGSLCEKNGGGEFDL